MKYFIFILLLFISATAKSEAILPVLMYHHIGSEFQPAEEVVALETFREQMKFLKLNGYKTITFAEAGALLESKVPLPKKYVVITFDDGWKDQLDAAKILRELNFSASFFIITGMFNNQKYMSAEQVKDLSAHFEIGAHSVTHFMTWANDLHSLPEQVMHSEIAASQDTLEALINKPILSVSWPFGYTKPSSIEFSRARGFMAGAMIYTGEQNHAGGNALNISRVNIDGRCDIDIFIAMVETGKETRCK